MPTICMFYGIIIRMYYVDHNPPHFHAFYGENVARLNFNGEVIEGTSHLDTASLTGESKPKKVTVGDQILSGCINQNNILKIKATTTYKTTTASKIIEIIEKSTENKAKTEKFITKFARVYTPIVVLSAFLLVLIPLLFGQEFKIWLYRALVFLVTSCPCALVISVPLGYFCGIGKASKEGILIKGSNYIETLASAKYVVFDKTGTVTQGVFEVTKVSPSGMTAEALLEYAALAESYSNHPISKSLKHAYGKVLDMTKVSDVQEIGGKGVTAHVMGKAVAVGN